MGWEGVKGRGIEGGREGLERSEQRIEQLPMSSISRETMWRGWS